MTFSKSFSRPLTDILNILWCKFSTGSPIYIYIFACIYVFVCAMYVYIYSSLQVFSTPFFSLQEKSLRVREKEGKNKNKRSKKKRSKKKNRIIKPLPSPTSCYFVEQRRRIEGREKT